MVDTGSERSGEKLTTIGAVDIYLKPHDPNPGNNHLKGGIFAVNLSRGFILVGGAEDRILNKTMI
jgi:hypothetical protein